MVVHQRELDRARVRRAWRSTGTRRRRRRRTARGRVRRAADALPPAAAARASRRSGADRDSAASRPNRERCRRGRARWRGGASRERAKASGHAEMHEQRVVAEPEQQIFAAPVERVDRAAGDGARRATREPASAIGGRRCRMAATRRPTTSGAKPRRVVSTSGSSGIGGRRERRSGRARRARFVAVAEYILRCASRRLAARILARSVAARQRQDGPSLAQFRRLLPAALPRACSRWSSRSAGVSRLRRARAAAAARKRARRGRRRLTAELMYRLLVGDIALQRGEPALAARAYFEAAREARDPALARRATEIALARAAARRLALEAARLWSELDPTAERPKQVVAALAERRGRQGSTSRRSPPTSRPSSSARSRRRPRRALALGEAFLQLNRLLAHEPDKAATFKLVALAREALSRMCPRRISPSRSPRSTPGSPTWRRAPRRCRRSIARSRSSRAGSGRCCSRRRSSPSGRRQERSTTSSSSSRRIPIRRRRSDARAVRVEQKRYARGARDLRAAVGQRQGQPRVPVRHGDAVDADEGLGDGRDAVRGAGAGRLRRRTAWSSSISRRSPRRRAATSSRSSATARCPTASARGSPSCAPRRCWASRARSTRRAAISPSCPR